MQIDFISDTVCPWCFIGKRRLARAMALRPNVLFDVRFRPFRLDPTIPKGGFGREEYLAAKFGKKGGIEERADAGAAALELLDIEWRLEPPQRVALRVVRKRLCVFPALLEGPAEREMQLRFVGAIALVALQQPLHRGDLFVGKGVVLEICEAPVGLATTGIELQCRLVGSFAVAPPAERLLYMAC